MAEDGSAGSREGTVSLAVLAILVALREDGAIAPGERRKTEVLLADVGMSLGDIALVTGKHYENVKTTLRRARLRGGGASRRPSGTTGGSDVAATEVRNAEQ